MCRHDQDLADGLESRICGVIEGVAPAQGSFWQLLKLEDELRQAVHLARVLLQVQGAA